MYRKLHPWKLHQMRLKPEGHLDFSPSPYSTKEASKITSRMNTVRNYCVEITKNPKFLVFTTVYFNFFLDNVLLTVIVPIIPDYLFHNHLNSSTTSTLNSLSDLQRKFQNLEKDSGPLGALLASKAFVQLLCTPIVGYATEYVGYHLPLLVGSINLLLATITFAFGSSYGSLVVARALHGSSSAAIAVGGMCLLAETLPKESRGRLMPLVFGGIALGVLIGYPLGGAAYQLLGKAAPFLFIAFLVLLNIALQLKNFDWDRFRDDSSDVTDSSVSVLDEGEASFMNLLKSKQISLVAGAICVCTSSMAILEPCVPMWLMAKFDPPPTKWQLGAVFIPDSVGYFMGSHLTGLNDMLPWRMAICAMLLTGLSCCALPMATEITDLTLPHFGLGLGVGILDATLVPLLANFADLTSTTGKSQYGPVYALQQAAVCLAYSLGPLFGGMAVHKVGFPWLIRFVGLLNVLYCPLLLELDEPRQVLCHGECNKLVILHNHL